MNETPSNIVGFICDAGCCWAKEIPDEGMATDIQVVSAFLPYCDAMFVDNKCWRIDVETVTCRIPMATTLPAQARCWERWPTCRRSK
jgi:hypothetical protein